MTALDPTERFTDRVEYYVGSRPGYPEAVTSILRSETGLTSHDVVADVGSGSGISSELFLKHGNPVYGVEPNQAMREAAERLLASYGAFRSVSGTAEETRLPDDSVDYVLAGQAFHWFDVPKARQEFDRILRTQGWVILMWNLRRVDATPFLRAYEDLLQRFGTDYGRVKKATADVGALRALFAGGEYEMRSLYNEQQLSREGLRARLLSSSYTPPASHPRHRPMLQELDRIFDRHADGDTVCLEYDTHVYWGRIR